MNHKNHKPYKNSRLEEVKKYLDMGLNPRAIAVILSTTTQCIYYYKSKITTR
jgi:hypothetical protein